jgi:hypothetical protein
MWLSLNKCFLSIVHKDCKPDELLVRARGKGDIEKVFPAAIGKRTKGTDYLFRAVVKRIDVSNALRDEVMAIDYDNFKDSVRDDELHRAYSSVWSVMSRLQEGGPYSNGRKNSFFDESDDE